MFRKTLFWLHLIAGVIAGIVIAIMSFTGAAIAFEKEIIAFVERDARRVVPPAPDAQALPMAELLRRVRETRPDAKPANLVVTQDRHAAVALSSGGRGPAAAGATGTWYVNPYTGEVREAGAARTRAFMRTMTAWHRWLGIEGEHRNAARAVTGACNAAFLVLGLTGIYLWWPRQWTRRAVRAVTLFTLEARGKARDFNWHNVIGIWSVLVLIVLTATALPISYRWAGDAIYRLTGTEPPPAGRPGAGAPGQGSAPAVRVPTPPEGTRPLSLDALLAAVQQDYPDWQQLTLRLPGGSAEREGGRPRAPVAQGLARSSVPPVENAGAASSGPGARTAGAMMPVTVTVKEAHAWPRTATTTLTLDPYTGTALRREGFGDFNLGRQVRTWTRFLHTGEALGGWGQLLAGIASLGGVVLVYTGFALSWRRFLRWRRQ